MKNIVQHIACMVHIALISTSLGMDKREGIDSLPKYSVVESHFKADVSLVHEALSSIKNPELHFFWTTGRHPDALKPDYGASVKVQVGGVRYGQKFPVYVDYLLAHSPSHLIIKFVCDAMTRDSNKEWIADLQKKHEGRFQILDIGNVVENLLTALPEESHEHINEIFKNATQGNPTISSDIYRLIAMVYGNNLKLNIEDVQGSQYTYCDIDTFCFGMEWGADRADQVRWEREGHCDLVNALFDPLQNIVFDTEIPFYFARKLPPNGNCSVVKLDKATIIL